MSKKLLFVAAALMTSVASFAQWTEPEIPTVGGEVVSGHQYMVKNVAASEANQEGRFLAGGASWYSWATSTVVIDQANALTFTLTNVEDKGWTFARTTDGKFTFISGTYDGKGEMHVDYNNQGENLCYFNIVKQENGYYRVQASEYNSTYYNADKWWGWELSEEATFPNAIYGTVAEADGYGLDFEFIDMSAYQARLNLYNTLLASQEYSSVDNSKASAVYENASATIEELDAAAAALDADIKVAKAYAVLNGATEDNPKDGTSLIDNSDFGAGNINGWECTFVKGTTATNIGYQGASYTNGDCTISGFIEAWANNVAEMKRDDRTYATIGDAELQQVLRALPAGKYVLGADVNAVQQYEGSANPVTGVQLFAADLSEGGIDNHINVATENGKPQHFELTFFSTGGDVALGLRTRNTTANWIGADNFTLTYYGEVEMDPHMAQLVSYIDECKEKFGDLEELKANKDVKDAFAEVMQEAESVVAGSEGDYEAMKDKLEAEAAKLQASVDDYKAFNDELQTIQNMIAQTEETFADLSSELADYYGELNDMYEECSADAEFIKGLSEAVQDKVRAFISENCKAGDDVTILLNNPNFDKNFSGWQVASGSATPAWGGCKKNPDGDLTGHDDLEQYRQTGIPGGNAEVYHNKFDIFQVIKNMPVGRYELSCKAFERDENGAVDAELYASVNGKEQSVKVMEINQDLSEYPIYVYGSETPDGNNSRDMGNGYAPDGMSSANWHFAAGYYKNKFNIIITESGDITVGIRTASASDWVLFDDFQLVYMGSGANVYEALIDEKIEIAQNVGQGDDEIMTREAEDKIEAAINAGEDAKAGDDADACIAALAQLDEAIAFGKEDIKLVASLSEMLTTYGDYLIAEVESSDTNFEDLLGKVNGKLEDADFATQQEVNDLKDEIKGAWAGYVMADCLDATEDEPADVSPVIFNRNGIDPVSQEASATGWTGGNAGVDGVSFELFNQNYDFNQTLVNLAPGFYRLMVQGYYRPTGWANRVDANDVDTLAHNAVLYAGETSTSLLVIKDDAKAYNELAGVAEEGVWAIPTTMLEAANAFENGLYQNILQFEVKEAGAKTVIGIRKSEQIGDDWTIFTNFQLQYLGTTTPTEDPTTDINGIEVVPTTLVIYDLAGRRVSKAQKGVYVINGKKVIR